MNAVGHLSIFQGFIAWLISCLSLDLSGVGRGRIQTLTSGMH